MSADQGHRAEVLEDPLTNRGTAFTEEGTLRAGPAWSAADRGGDPGAAGAPQVPGLPGTAHRPRPAHLPARAAGHQRDAAVADAVPITPGGLGITELGLVGVLATGAGHTVSVQVTASVLLYRAVTYLPSIPLGALACLIWRHAPALISTSSRRPSRRARTRDDDTCHPTADRTTRGDGRSLRSASAARLTAGG